MTFPWWVQPFLLFSGIVGPAVDLDTVNTLPNPAFYLVITGYTVAVAVLTVTLFLAAIRGLDWVLERVPRRVR